jgi:hypothetical protein
MAFVECARRVEQALAPGRAEILEGGARFAYAADYRVRAAIDERQAFSDPGQDRGGVDPARRHGGSAGR